MGRAFRTHERDRGSRFRYYHHIPTVGHGQGHNWSNRRRYPQWHTAFLQHRDAWTTQHTTIIYCSSAGVSNNRGWTFSQRHPYRNPGNQPLSGTLLPIGSCQMDLMG